MSLAFIPLYIRFLGIEGWGLVGFFLTFQAWSLVLDAGLSMATSREMARWRAGAVAAPRLHGLFRAVERVSLGTAGVVALSGAALAWPLAHHGLQPHALDTRHVEQAIALMGLACATQWMATLYRQALMGLQRQLWVSGYGAIAATLRGAGTVAVLVTLSPTIDAYLGFQVLAGLVESLVLRAALARRLPSPSRPPWALRDAVRALAPFCTGVALTTLLATLLTQADKLLLAQLVSLAQFGFFMLAVAVAGGLAVVIVPVQNVAYPRLSELAARGDSAAVAADYHLFAQLMSVLLLPPAAMLCLFPRDVMLAWTGNASTADAVAPLLAVYALGTMLNGLMHIPYVGQLAHGWPRLSAIQNTIAVVLVLPALLWGVPRHGAVAAAWVWVGLNAGFLLLGTHAMHRRILRGERSRWLLRDIAAPLAGTLAVAALLALLRQRWTSPSRVELALFLFGGAALGVLVASLCCPEGRLGLRTALGAMRARSAH